MSFDSFGLEAGILRAVREQGYDTPTPIQLAAIPVVMDGHDLMAGAQTGTGKTAGFTLPMLHRLHQRPAGDGKRAVRALVLTPTRELAAQVADSIAAYGKHLDLQSAVIFGGVNIRPQAARLRRGVDIVVATPGRLLDHARQGNIDLSRVEIFVLDEADRMLDMGFIHDIRRVIERLPPREERQSLLFSATFSADIKQLANGLLNRPRLIEAAGTNTAAVSVTQKVLPVDKLRKRELLSHLVGANNWRQVLVFSRTKHGANRLARQLEADGLEASAIHGNKSQGARTKALAEFKAGKVRVLVATDIAARGLDIDQLPHVINFDLPNVPEDYVHRIGRTGRAGREGEALSLVSPDEAGLLRDIERLLGRSLPREVVPGYEAGKPGLHAAEPEREERRGPPRNRSGQGAAKQKAGRGGRSGRGGHGQDRDRQGARDRDSNGRGRGRQAGQTRNGSGAGNGNGRGRQGGRDAGGNGNQRNGPRSGGGGFVSLADRLMRSEG